MVCGFAVRVWVLWGFLLVLLLGFPSGGYGCWVRVEAGRWLLCGGFGAVLGVGAYSVSAGWFVAGGVVTVGMTVRDFFWVSVRGLLSPLFVAGLPVCRCVFGLLWLMAGEGHGGVGGLVAVLLGCPVGFFLMGVLLWRERGCEGGFWGCVVMCGEWVCWGGRG